MTDAPFTIEMMDAKELAANPNNFRAHPERQKKEINRSIGEFGWLQAVIYNSRTRRLIDGHARVEAAAAKGEEVPVRVINVDPKTERRIMVSLQRTNDLGLNDDEMLAQLLQTVAQESDDLPPGWSGKELEAMLETLNEDHYDEEDCLDEEEETDEAAVPLIVPPSSIRMVQLFLTVESEPRFRDAVESLAAAWNLETCTDVVYRAVMKAAGAFGNEHHELDTVDLHPGAETSGVFGGDVAG